MTTATKPATRHLSNCERNALADLFADCDPHEFLQCVAGLVAHNVGNYEDAMEAQDLIRKAARVVRGK